MAKTYEFGGQTFGDLRTAIAVAERYRMKLVGQIRFKKSRTLPSAFATYKKWRGEYLCWTRGKPGGSRTRQDFLLEGLRKMEFYVNSRAEYVRQQGCLAELRERLAEARRDIEALRAQEDTDA